MLSRLSPPVATGGPRTVQHARHIDAAAAHATFLLLRGCIGFKDKMKTLRGVIVPGARHHNVDPSVTVLLLPPPPADQLQPKSNGMPRLTRRQQQPKPSEALLIDTKRQQPAASVLLAT